MALAASQTEPPITSIHVAQRLIGVVGMTHPWERRAGVPVSSWDENPSTTQHDVHRGREETCGIPSTSGDIG